jgi:hypothetical protein
MHFSFNTVTVCNIEKDFVVVKSHGWSGGMYKVLLKNVEEDVRGDLAIVQTLWWGGDRKLKKYEYIPETKESDRLTLENKRLKQRIKHLKKKVKKLEDELWGRDSPPPQSQYHWFAGHERYRNFNF